MSAKTPRRVDELQRRLKGLDEEGQTEAWADFLRVPWDWSQGETADARRRDARVKAKRMLRSVRK